MDTPESRRIAEVLLHRAGPQAGAGQVADALVAIWQEIVSTLSPIVGPRGVAALFVRSIHVAGKTHPWWLGLGDDIRTAVDLNALQALVAAQASAQAAAAGSGVLLQTFHDLLASLVGVSLTERLLCAVWLDFLSGDAAQDPIP